VLGTLRLVSTYEFPSGSRIGPGKPSNWVPRTGGKVWKIETIYISENGTFFV